MRFSDIVICVATMAVIFALIACPFEIVLVSALGLTPGYDISIFITLFLSSLISGYIYAEKIREARREAITKITVLWAAFLMPLAVIVPAATTNWGKQVKEMYEAAYPGTTLSTSEWVNWEMMQLDSFMFLIVGIALLFGSIGLYAGSMLRKPVKIQE